MTDDNNVMYEKVKFFRLISGEDVISEITFNDDGTISLINPMRLVIDADFEQSRQTIYMHNWIPQGVAKGNTIKVKQDNILFSSPVEEDIVDYYCQVVYDIFSDPPSPTKTEKEYIDPEKKIVSLKFNKDKPNQL